MAKKDDERDETPTRLTHVNGANVVVPAYRAEELVAAGLFTPAKKK
jgi:hypothetical protein